jgi:tRNA pseudouridine55 synthase
MNGFLNIDKPAGMTSHDVVARVRRLAPRGVKVGHAGTLDPAATGVLPLALGSATRLIEYLAEARKGYRAVQALGRTTTTDDGEGELVAERAVPALSREKLEAALLPFRGAIMQVPPMYSALHHEGKRLYELAREGVTVELAARPLTIYRLELLDYSVERAELLLDIDCSKGTYIRALARDIGAALGCGAHLATLRRTFVGAFRAEQSTPLAELIEQPAQLPALLLPPELAVAAWPLITLDADGLLRVRRGQPLALTALAEAQARAHDATGALVALLRWEDGLWKPDKVFNAN